MLKYIFKRILFFMPTLVVISLLAFIISVNAPGDPVDRMMNVAQSADATETSANQIAQKKYWQSKLGLDLPLFYFSVSSLAACDTLYKIDDKTEQEAIERLTLEYGNSTAIQQFHQSINQLVFSFSEIKNDTANQHLFNLKDEINNAMYESMTLKSVYHSAEIENKIASLKTIFSKNKFDLQTQRLKTVETNFAEMKLNSSVWKNYIPVVHFHLHNQYHRWLFGDGNWLTGSNSTFSKGLLRGDFGISYSTKQKVQTLLTERIPWSLFFSIISILIAYCISIPLGIFAAAKKGTKLERFTSVLVFMLPAMPVFWVATLLLMTFANPEVWHWFPASGVMPTKGFGADETFFQKIIHTIPYLILPLICYSYSSIAFLSRTMRVGMLESLNQDYIRTARAKGLSEKQVVLRHAFKNSLLPIITVFATIFPMAVGGSVILETIFTIPGIGSAIFEAIGNQDYPVIIAVFTITGVMTMIGYLVSDILYAIVDPRISFK